jgi:hypothetical protein
MRLTLYTSAVPAPEALMAAAKQDRKSCPRISAPTRFSGKHGSSRSHCDGDGVEKSADTGCVQCCMKSVSKAGHDDSVVKTVAYLDVLD